MDRARAGLAPDTIGGELRSYMMRGLVEQVVSAGVRYRLTSAGRSHLAALTASKAA